MRSSQAAAAVGWLSRVLAGAANSSSSSSSSSALTATALAAAAAALHQQVHVTTAQAPLVTFSSSSSSSSSTGRAPFGWVQQQQQQQQCRGMSTLPELHSTTILCVRNGSEVVIMGDGQATQGDFVVKPNVKKVRRIGSSAVGGFAGVAVDGLSLLERLEAKLEEHPGQLQRAAVELAKMWRQDKLLRELDASLIVADATGTFWLMGNGDVLEAEADGVIGIGSGADFAESAARALLQLQRDLQQQQQQQGGGVESGGVVAAGSEGSDTALGSEGSGATAAAGPAAAAAAAGAGGVAPELLPVLELSLFDVARTAMTIAANSCIYTNSNFSWQHIKPDGSIESGNSSSSSSGGGGGGGGGGGDADGGEGA